MVRMPVLGPFVARYATGTQLAAVKNTMQSALDFQSSPNSAGPSIPSENWQYELVIGTVCDPAHRKDVGVERCPDGELREVAPQRQRLSLLLSISQSPSIMKS